MKRGASSASSSGRSSGSRNTNTRHHADDDTFQAGSAPSRESLPAATSATSAASAGHGEGTNYLVALAGMRALESHVQDSSRGKRWKDRVTSWEERAGLGLPSVKLALGFLDVLGVSRASVYKQLLENALRALLDQIPHLAEDRMLLLLNDSFRYATQPELKSVPLKIITSMSAVPDKVLEKIIELQTHEPSQFEELGLPLAIKRLAWEKDAKLFVRIASPHAGKYISSEYAPKMIAASQQVRFYKHLDTMKRRKLMGPQRINALAECTGVRPILIGYLCDDIAEKFKEESSLSKAGMWATLLTDVLVTARERAYGSIADQSVDRLCALASRLDLAVRDDLFGDAAVRDVQRLFREATGIVEGQQEVTKGTKRAALDKAKAEDESTKLRKTLKSAWSAVSKMDSHSWFKEAVTEAIALGYHKVVKVPMDLGTILKKIKGGGYPSFGDFDRDLKLMWENCRLYNSASTDFHQEALRLEKEWSKVSTSFEDTLRHGQNRPGQSSSTAGAGSSNKRKGSSSSQDDARGGSGDAPLAAMAPATQLDGQGLGRRVGLAAMLLSEPFVAKLMYRHASERVPEACRAGETLPRSHPTFAPLMQLLELGDAARAMFRAGSFGVRAVEQNLTRAVLPCVVALHARAERAIARRAADGPERPDGSDGPAAGAETPAAPGAAAAAAAAAAVAAAVAAAKKKKAALENEADAAAAPPQDWKTWYKEFPAVRRVVCTMLCRALVRGGDEAAALMMPAARAAVRKMADEQWLWASLAELLQKSATLVAKAGGDARKAGRVLQPETLKSILELFLRGLESAAVSDAVFSRALNLVANLLQLASRSAAATATAGTPAASSSSSSAAVVAGAKVVGTKPIRAKQPGGVPRAALEELVDKAAARAVRPPRKPRTEAEEERVKGEFERVFSLAPGWKNKLQDKKKEAAAAAAAAAAVATARREASEAGGARGRSGGGKGGSGSARGGGGGGKGGSGSGKGGGGGGKGGGEEARPPRPPRSISIKGPKSFTIKGPKRKGGEGGHAGGSEPAPKKRSRG